ncbi:MAG: hypothetical protein GWP61_15455 [Chloroflexi bacterium]|jgi:hypothetical protein|nr:hypothetical protein [Chloroflexota bacterium]
MPAPPVDVWVRGDNSSIITTTDGTGIWTADFCGTTYLIFLSDGGSRQVDDGGDETGVWRASLFDVGCGRWVIAGGSGEPRRHEEDVNHN